MVDHGRLGMSVGEAMFTQRSIRRFRPDPIPIGGPSTGRSRRPCGRPNGGNRQIARFLVVTDRERIARFGALYREAWWAKRRDEHGWTGPKDIPPDATNYRAAAGLADHMRDVPCVVLAFTEPPGWANSHPARLPEPDAGGPRARHRLHPDDAAPIGHDARVHALRRAGIGLISLLHPARLPGRGYPLRGSRRRPTRETTYLDHWGAPVPWT